MSLDADAYYPASVTSKAFDLDPSIARKKRITESYLAAAVQPDAVITQTVVKDWGTETFTDTVALAAAGSETRTRRRFEAVDVADAVAIQIQLGDDGTVTNSPVWTLDRWVGLVDTQEGAK